MHVPGSTPPSSRRGWWAWYRAYLRSPEWKAIAAACVALAGAVCEACGVAPKTTRDVRKKHQVHHTTYVRVGRELLSDLLYLCPRCHRKAHT